MTILCTCVDVSVRACAAAPGHCLVLYWAVVGSVGALSSFSSLSRVSSAKANCHPLVTGESRKDHIGGSSRYQELFG